MDNERKINPPRTNDGERRPEFYYRHEKLGGGSYGKVYRVKSSDNQKEYAIKIMNLKKLNVGQDEIKYIYQEINILASVNHTNIIKYYDSWESDAKILIVTEYCLHRDLYQYVKNNGVPEEPQLIKWIQQIASALKHLHERGYVHRNVKPQNVMVNSELTLKIGDFGTARLLPADGMVTSVLGTPYFMSPEMLNQQPYSKETDMWSFGCLLYFLITGKILHKGESMVKLMQFMSSGSGLGEHLEELHVNSDIKVLVTQLLSQKPSERPTAEAVLKKWRSNIKEESFDSCSQESTVTTSLEFTDNSKPTVLLKNPHYQLPPIVARELKTESSRCVERTDSSRPITVSKHLNNQSLHTKEPNTSGASSLEKTDSSRPLVLPSHLHNKEPTTKEPNAVSSREPKEEYQQSTHKTNIVPSRAQRSEKKVLPSLKLKSSKVDVKTLQSRDRKSSLRPNSNFLEHMDLSKTCPAAIHCPTPIISKASSSTSPSFEHDMENLQLQDENNFDQDTAILNPNMDINSAFNIPDCDIQPTETKESIVQCEIIIQQFLSQNLGEYVYMAALSCLHESDVRKVLSDVKNALGVELFETYFIFFLRLWFIYHFGDQNILDTSFGAL